MSRRLFQLTQQAAHRVRTHADQQSKAALGVTAAQLAMLFVIERSPGCTQRDVARALGVRESAVTAAVGRLLGGGLLAREPLDKRTFALSLTPAGQAATRAARPLVAALEARLSADFTEPELAVIERFLRGALAAFGEEP